MRHRLSNAQAERTLQEIEGHSAALLRRSRPRRTHKSTFARFQQKPHSHRESA